MKDIYDDVINIGLVIFAAGVILGVGVTYLAMRLAT